MVQRNFIFLLIIVMLSSEIIQCSFLHPVRKSMVINHPYKTKYFETLIDHFSYKNDSLKFRMKYLISTEKWVKGNAILFFCGNEENIEFFAAHSGFIWELGEQLSAMVVFAEHRFYGSSLPFGNQSFSNAQYFGYLNSEQTLADFADLISYLKGTIVGAENSPVIAFGGSYGGMLAAWFRQKYPHLIAGSLASSAPLNFVENLKMCNTPYQIITKAFEVKGSKECVQNIRRVWSIIDKMRNVSGLKNLTKIFHTCEPLESVESLMTSLSDSLFLMSMANFPYPTNFLRPMPSWPITAFCKNLSKLIPDSVKLLEAIHEGIQVYDNYTGLQLCLSLPKPNVTDTSANGWSVQLCTDIPMLLCTNGITDMFYKNNNLTKEEYANNCNVYGVRPRWGWYKTSLWNNRLASTSNIIFSNGLLDPWAAGGIFHSSNKRIKIINIPNGAHHVDLRSSHPLDTPDIKRARRLEKAVIKKWIKEWKRHS